jgi:hypothetical protein
MEVFSDEIEAITPMPLNMLTDRMWGSLVCLAARKGNSPPQCHHVRPFLSAEGEPVPITAREPSLKALMDAFAEDEFSPDW